MADASPMTLAEYRALPEGSYQLIEGCLIVLPSPSPWHQRLVSRLAIALDTFVNGAGLGWVYMSPLDVYLRQAEPPIVVQPDVLFVAREDAAQLTDFGVDGPPALVIEVLTPGHDRLDALTKRALYDEYGVQEYWMVLPDMHQVEVLRREGAAFGRPVLLERADVLATPLLPGFELTLEQLFAPER